jgi:hypothetical protein
MHGNEQCRLLSKCYIVATGNSVFFKVDHNRNAYLFCWAEGQWS